MEGAPFLYQAQNTFFQKKRGPDPNSYCRSSACSPLDPQLSPDYIVCNVIPYLFWVGV